MSSKKTILKTMPLSRLLSVCMMLVCLVFLTSINFFMYPPVQDKAEANIFGMNAEESESDYPPTGPTEEKSGNAGFSIAEEILHEAHPEFNFLASNQFYLHHIAEAANIEMFHPELILPPPKL